MIDRITEQPFCQTRFVRQCKKTADPQMAHLVFADTRANAEKPKEPFFANAPLRILTLKTIN